MKKILTSIFILIIVLPMFIYLNPFTWGLRAYPSYRPSLKTEKLIDNLNDKYKIQISISENADTVWYFRDIKNKKDVKKENFELILKEQDSRNIKKETVKSYIEEFNSNFEHKSYFDSILVGLNYDSLIYKIKIR